MVDSLLFYGPPIRTDAVRVPLSTDYTEKFYRHRDHRGLYRHDHIILSASMARPNLTYEYKGFTPPFGWRMTKDKIAALDADNRIAWSASGRPYLKRYLNENKGQVPSAIWTDIPPISGRAKERVGYPTQKPVALLERIIKASSNTGDMILDPFCGCATACITAQGLHRQWVGIDISSKAAELVQQRMKDELGLFGKVIHRTDIPQRTDLGKLSRYNAPENRRKLYGLQEGNCTGCREHFESRHLEVDHIISRKKGGADHLENLQLLCGNCNRVKGDRGMDYLKAKLQIR